MLTCLSCNVPLCKILCLDKYNTKRNYQYSVSFKSLPGWWWWYLKEPATRERVSTWLFILKWYSLKRKIKLWDFINKDKYDYLTWWFFSLVMCKELSYEWFELQKHCVRNSGLWAGVILLLHIICWQLNSCFVTFIPFYLRLKQVLICFGC